MRARLDGLATLLLCGLSAGVIAQVLSYMQYGFDFTDEAYYLVWMKDPFYYDFSVSQSGYVYFPLFHGLSQNIHLVRIANIVITYTLSFVLSFSVLRVAGRGIGSGALRVALALALATTSVIFIFSYPPTPSYNNLAFQALALTAIGMIYANREASKASLAGWALVGMGGWLAFMAKPSTAAAMAPVVLVLIVLAGKWSLRGLAAAVSVAALLLVVSAQCIDGSLGGFWNRMVVGLQMSAQIGAGYTLGDILRLGRPSLTARDGQVALVAASFLTLAGIVFRMKPSASVAGVAVAVLLACCFAAVLIAVYGILPDIAIGAGARTVLLAFPLTSLVIASPALLRLARAQRESSTPGDLRGNYVFGLCFCAMPLVYAFGSNGNYWNRGGDAGLFWVLAGVFFAIPATGGRASMQRFTPLALAAPLLSLFFLQYGWAKPYRQPQPLWQNNQAMELGEPPSTLILSSGYASYIKEAKQETQRAGFQAGTPVIDLSGQSPGILFAIGARNAGYPWLSGGYPGSAVVVRAALGRVPCADLARAWVLLEPQGPRAIDNSVLSVFGADVDADFAVAAEWLTAAGAGSYQERRAQQLLRPVRDASVALSACVGAVEVDAAQRLAKGKIE